MYLRQAPHPRWVHVFALKMGQIVRLWQLRRVCRLELSSFFSAINFKLKIISVKIMKNNIHRELYKLRIKRNCARIKKSTILLIKLTNETIKILTEHNSNSNKR